MKKIQMEVQYLVLVLPSDLFYTKNSIQKLLTVSSVFIIIELLCLYTLLMIMKYSY